MKDDSGFLMMEPRAQVAPTPIIDSLTRRVAAAMRKAEKSDYGYRGSPKEAVRGMHHCTGKGCGVASDNHDYFITISGVRYLTNSLAVHYVAYHRHEISPAQMALIQALPDEEVDPTESELAHPGKDKPHNPMSFFRPTPDSDEVETDDDKLHGYKPRPGYR
jgi:hypothetical protein